MPTIRPFHPCDLPAIYRICLLTADAGGDASGRHDDPDLLGHVWAGAYPMADPGLCWVVTDDRGVAGYLLATADTAGFEGWCERHWWPALRERYPLGLGSGRTAADTELVERLHDPHLTDVPAGHPAHLHIDLLPRLQGHGMGRALIETLLAELGRRGVPGVHLGVHPANVRAKAFYAHLGFVPSAADPGILIRPVPAIRPV
ncbi:MAG: GNAT family N-acetyltransferase [Actinobacteria bacterium]|nr:GNAT family N-acetyltransferase [Actinomycetota bacterium]MCG2801041.1 GNAT family N-acetyltransferase [Cellulomonas sp.]